MRWIRFTSVILFPTFVGGIKSDPVQTHSPPGQALCSSTNNTTQKLGLTNRFGMKETIEGNDSAETKDLDVISRLNGKPIVETVGVGAFKSDVLTNRVVLLHYWMTSCRICRRSIAELKRIRQKYQGTDLTIVGVTIDTSPDDVRLMMKELKIEWPQLIERNKWVRMLREQTETLGMPSWWLIGRDGRIVSREAIKATDDKIDRLLKKR